METLIDYILDKIDPIIEEIIKKYEKIYIDDFNRTMTKTDKEFTRLNLKYDMLKSIEVYTKPTDKLIYANFKNTPKGSLVISSIIERDGKRYEFSTEVIYAGGYNIQRLHFRYITKTELTRTNNNTKTTEIKEKLQKLTKIEKIKKEIDELEKRINKNTENINKNKKLTDDEILKLKKWDYDLDWNEIVKRGADVNYNYDKEEFEKSHNDYKQKIIDSFKDLNIKFLEENNNQLRKNIVKFKDKLSKLQ